MDDTTVKVQWKWLKYNIDQETSKIARCLITGDTTGDIGNEIQTDGSQFDANYCKRKITEGCSKIEDMLYKFFSSLVISNEDGAISLDADDTLLHDAISWELTFSNFGDRRNIDPKLLATEIHQYLVLYVLQDWCKLTHPKMEEDYIARLTAEEGKLKSIVFRKGEPKRPE